MKQFCRQFEKYRDKAKNQNRPDLTFRKIVHKRATVNYFSAIEAARINFKENKNDSKIKKNFKQTIQVIKSIQLFFYLQRTGQIFYSQD